MRSAIRLASLAGALLALVPASFAAEAASPAASEAESATQLRFDGTIFVHRWSKSGTNEFTPPSQTDLDHWDDMVTLLVYDRFTTPEQLGQAAVQLVANYKRDGLVLRTRFIAATPDRPAEYFIAGILPGGGIDEIVFTRLVMTDGVGAARIVAHRLYGSDKRALAEGSADWLQANGARTEAALLDWHDLPSVAALRTLPQAP